MATLQRSGVSFRRQGSSGLVWEWDNDKVLFGDENGESFRNLKLNELRQCYSAKSIDMTASDGAADPPPVCPRSLSSSSALDSAASRKKINNGCRRGGFSSFFKKHNFAAKE